MKKYQKQIEKKAVIYARVSSERQAEEGFSIDAQLDLLRDYALTNSFEVVHEYTDEETAKSVGRTQYGQMIDFIKANPFVRTILVEKTDRLYRNFRDFVDLEDLDTIVHLVKEGGIISSESSSHSKFVHGIKVLMAKNYIDNLSEEVKKGMNKKASLGQWPSKSPIGYMRNLQDHLIYVDSQKAPFVARLFEEYATGRYSLKFLEEFAYNLGLRSVNGKKINKAGIHRILKNQIYTGKYFEYKNVLYENGIHEAIISVELYNAVQQVLNGGKTPKMTKRNFAFRGLVKCDRCGCSMTPDIKKGKYIYYRCTQFKGKCKNSVKENRLSELFGEVVKRISLSSKAAEGLKAALRESHSDKEEFQRKSIKSLQNRYDRIRGYQEKAYEDRLNGLIDEDFWKRKSYEWNTELRQIEIQISKHRHANHEYLEMGSQIIELAKQAYDLYLHQSNDDRRHLLKYLLSNCTIDDGSLCVTYRKPFNIFAEGGNLKIKRG